VAGRSASYAPRRPADSLLYRIVQEHWETFRSTAGRLRDGEGLPAFVEDEFRTFLRCGWLAGGFARFRCGGCGAERLVAFSCKAWQADGQELYWIAPDDKLMAAPIAATGDAVQPGAPGPCSRRE
jgi:hypothetical protein